MTLGAKRDSKDCQWIGYAWRGGLRPALAQLTAAASGPPPPLPSTITCVQLLPAIHHHVRAAAGRAARAKKMRGLGDSRKIMLLRIMNSPPSDLQSLALTPELKPHLLKRNRCHTISIIIKFLSELLPHAAGMLCRWCSKRNGLHSEVHDRPQDALAAQLIMGWAGSRFCRANALHRAA